MYKRTETRQVKVGNLLIGGNNDVVLQSMTNTKTADVEKTIEQIKELIGAGAKLVRLAVFDNADALAIKEIKAELKDAILVADIHFNHKLALTAIESGIDKIRINPGNIGSLENVKAVVEACKAKNIPIRIGVNGGSLEAHILEKYNDKVCAGALVDSALYHVKILEDLDFHDIIISVKASNVNLTVASYLKLAEKVNYPLHLGVTEAGTSFGGTIKSSVGMGILLNAGIGSTMRISLSDNPVKELSVGKEILKSLELITGPTLISCPTCGRIAIDLIPVAKEIEEFLKTIEAPITVSVLGCAVNGPGEAKESDIGIAGGRGQGLLFKKGVIVEKVPEAMLTARLKEEITILNNEYLKNKE